MKTVYRILILIGILGLFTLFLLGLQYYPKVVGGITILALAVCFIKMCWEIAKDIIPIIIFLLLLSSCHDTSLGSKEWLKQDSITNARLLAPRFFKDGYGHYYVERRGSWITVHKDIYLRNHKYVYTADTINITADTTWASEEYKHQFDSLQGAEKALQTIVDREEKAKLIQIK